MLCGVTATVGSNPTATASFPRYCNEKQYRGIFYLAFIRPLKRGEKLAFHPEKFDEMQDVLAVAVVPREENGAAVFEFEGDVGIDVIIGEYDHEICSY